MTNFLIDSIVNFFNLVKVKIWPNQSIKRRRDSFEDDEDEDSIVGCQTLSKRPKWMNSPYSSSPASISDGHTTPASSSKNNVYAKPRVKKSLHSRMNQEIKENGAEIIEVVDLDDVGQTSTESRPPLSDLAIRTKPKMVSSDIVYIKTSSRPTHRSHVNERKQNGFHPVSCNTFTTPLRPTKNSAPRQTAFNETFKMSEKMKYSKLLAEYHNASKLSSSFQDLHQKNKSQPLLSESSQPSSSNSKTIEVIDLTNEEKKRTVLPVKPWKGKADKDIEIIETRSVPQVNSLERHLAQHRLVSPQWIIDMRNKYDEKEREMMRQVKEEQLKKELYAKHNRTKYNDALEERIKRHLKITDVVVDDTEAVQPIPKLSDEMKAQVVEALKPHPPSEKLVQGFNLSITRNDIQTLNKLNWLNDEVINFYMELIMERSKKNDNYPNVYAFNTFFYPQLISRGYSSLRRWTRKVDIFSNDMILVPIHLGMHWCMAIIFFKEKAIRYYDSMGSENNKCLNALLQYLKDEHMDKKKTPFDTNDWKLENVKDIPQQMNGSDCGMFSCMFAEYISRNAKITFSQKDMPDLRRKMVYEIIKKTLLQ